MNMPRSLGEGCSEAAVDEGRDFLVVDAGNRVDGLPKHSVVDYQQVNALDDSVFEGEETSIHRGADLQDLPLVFDLEAVAGSLKVWNFQPAGPFIAVGDDFLKVRHERLSGLAGPHLARLVLLEESVELADAGRVAHLAERLGLDLADSLAGHLKLLSHFLKSAAVAVLQTESQ